MVMNMVIISGNLGADPEVRTTGGGTAVADLRVATNERKQENGEWVDHTEWHRVTCFGKTAENVGRYLNKGSKLLVRGKIRTRKWQDKDGNDKYTTEIVADDVEFLSSPGGGERQEPGRGGGGRASSSSASARKSQQAGGGWPAGSADDDLPF